MGEVILDALLDTLKLLPFLLLSYVLIEVLEHKTKLSASHKLLHGRCAPLLGAATGILPQCGFSVMAAKLYETRHITVGTLIAVFLATSDEAFILLLVNGRFAELGILLLSKMAIGAGVGMLADLFVKSREREEEGEEFCGEHCCMEHKVKTPFFVYFVTPLVHALKVAAVILVVNFLFGLLFYFLGEESVVGFLQGGVWIQPLVAPLVGMIPNCASSVLLTQTMIAGGMTFSSLLAGLCANAGVGLFELVKDVRHWKRNLLILLTLYLVSVAVGYIGNLIQIL